jgi:uncharacterized membrane protein
MAKTSMGMEENVASLLCYVLGWITGIIFFLVEKENKTVRFHAMQSIVVFGAITIMSIALGWIPLLGYIISGLLGIIALGLWIFLMIKAYQGEKYKLPIAGDIAEKQA